MGAGDYPFPFNTDDINLPEDFNPNEYGMSVGQQLENDKYLIIGMKLLARAVGCMFVHLAEALENDQKSEECQANLYHWINHLGEIGENLHEMGEVVFNLMTHENKVRSIRERAEQQMGAEFETSEVYDSDGRVVALRLTPRDPEASVEELITKLQNNGE